MRGLLLAGTLSWFGGDVAANTCDPWQYTDEGGTAGGSHEAYLRCHGEVRLMLICHLGDTGVIYASEGAMDETVPYDEKNRLRFDFSSGSFEADASLDGWLGWYFPLGHIRDGLRPSHPFVAAVRQNAEVTVSGSRGAPRETYPLRGSSGAIDQMFDQCRQHMEELN
ncbi:hypothetical protein AADZ90_003165 [Aestuariibius sp. 2305UL40-4]